jgi:hypothetical protein
MKKSIFTLVLLFITLSIQAQRWSETRAQVWYQQQPWLVGCNYIPATAVNQIEMWSAATFDAVQIDRELSWAEGIGFNTLRVFLSSVVWQYDDEGMKLRMDRFLQLCQEHHIRPLFVFLDDCWNAESSYGKQPAPRPGVHNSGWVRDPSMSERADTTLLYKEMRTYVQDILRTFRNDTRILMWDLYNEAGNSGLREASLPLLQKVFEWARAVNPSQPLSACVWQDDLKPLNAYVLTHSDVITYHCYAGPDEEQHAIDTLRDYRRPLICTEYMARTLGCTFQNALPVFHRNHVAAYNWGFVAGKTNTIFRWGKVESRRKEPKVWFHDVFRQDGSPYDPSEILFLKEMLLSDNNG